MNLPAYLETKPSGFKGLGNLPKHWEVIRGRFVMRVNPPAPLLRNLKPEDEFSFVPMDAVGEYGGLNLEQTRVIADVSGGYTEFQDGDVVVAKITPCFENGKAALARGLLNGAAYGTTELHVLRADPTLDRGFLFYVVISDRFRKLGESEMYGAGGQKRVPPEFNKDFPMPVPPSPEQQQIAAFLDWKTGQIDALIAQKEQLLEKLTEKRLAVITQAVTKGLNPAAPMRDSGIPWLGQVPQHWEVKRLRFLLCERFTNGLFKKAEFWGDGNRIINVTDLYVDNDLVDETRLERLECEESEIKTYSANHGDFFVVRSSLKLEGIGKSATLLNPSEPTVFECHIVRGRPMLDKVDPRFLNLAMNSTYARQYFITSANVVTMATIDQERIKNLFVPLPGHEEQQKIAEYLDKYLARIDAMVSRVEMVMKRLTEYRSALITAATTGKIDVRNIKVPTQAQP
jgi:type I restriction enzyme, S subunit